MGLQQKRKDPRKKKKVTEAFSKAVAENNTQPGKHNVLSKTVSEASTRLKSMPAPSLWKSAKPAAKDAESGVRGYVAEAAQFLREVRMELKKVTWPSRKQTIGSTAVVLLLVILVSIFLGVVDFGLSSLVRIVIG